MKWLRPIGVFVVVAIVGWWFALGPRLDELAELEAAELRLKEQYLEKKKQAVNVDLLREQLRAADTQFGHLLRELPSRVWREFPEVIAAAGRRGVRIDELRPDPYEDRREFYAEQVVALRVTGRYHDLGRFAGDIANAPGSLLLQDLRLDAAPGRLVTMSATLRAFRYRDEEEIAAERKASRKGAKK